MKRILALLLVFVMVFALAACTKPAEPTDPSTPSGPSNPSNPTNPTGNGGGDIKGKTLQIWAVVGPEYETEDKIDAKVWLWMVRAAIVEWAHLNDVNLNFVSNFDQTSLMAAIHSGSKPDLVFTSGNFPSAANLGLLETLNAEQQAKIAEVIGDSWFLEHRGDVYGIQAPWCGAAMVYYNESMMELYGVKTPKEYIEAGEWTWENYLKICRECTRDTDGNGTIDTWGSTTYSVGGGFGAAWTVDPATGKLLNAMETTETKAWLDLLFDAVVENPCLTNNYKFADTPGSGIAMSIGDCEPYNFYHTYKTLSNGDVIRAVQMPTRFADDEVTFKTTTWMFAVPKNSDEVDAAVDLICYIAKAGMKWMEDHSKGLFETEWEGITGATDYSAAWLEQYNDFMDERDERYAEIEEMWDVAFNETMMNLYKENLKTFGGNYAGVSSPWQGATSGGYDFSSIFKAPPATSLPTLSAAVQAMIDKYNDLYVFD